MIIIYYTKYLKVANNMFSFRVIVVILKMNSYSAVMHVHNTQFVFYQTEYLNLPEC